MTALLALEGVSVRYGSIRAVDRVSLAVEQGETLGLIGESGSGKSSLARAAVGLAAVSEGRIFFEGRAVDQARRSERRFLPDRVQMLFQDPAASLSPRQRVRRLIEEPLGVRGRLDGEGWAEVEALIREVGLTPEIVERYPHQLSGGQARRVALIRALAVKPRLLIADEPTAGLDLSVQGDMLNLLRRLKDLLGLSYLFISHNLNVVGRVTDRLAVMYLATLVETGPTAEIFARPAHPYTAALLSSNLVIDPARRGRRIVLDGEPPSPSAPPPGCRFHQRCPIAQDVCRTTPPALADLGRGRAVACHFPLPQNVVPTLHAQARSR